MSSARGRFRAFKWLAGATLPTIRAFKHQVKLPWDNHFGVYLNSKNVVCFWFPLFSPAQKNADFRETGRPTLRSRPPVLTMGNFITIYFDLFRGPMGIPRPDLVINPESWLFAIGSRSFRSRRTPSSAACEKATPWSRRAASSLPSHPFHMASGILLRGGPCQLVGG